MSVQTLCSSPMAKPCIAKAIMQSGGSKSGVDLPEMYLACGTADSLYGVNERACDELRNLGFDVVWDEAPYGHEWDFWDLEVKKLIDWLPLERDGAGVNSGNVGI